MHTATPYNIFRLLVPATGTTPPNAPKIELEGTPWTMTDDMPMFDGNIPEYTCISYSWGSGRTANPLVPGEMSDRVIPVIEATIRAVHPAAIWIDAFCIPHLEPAREACLLSLGALYSSAAQVVAVLSKPCSAFLGDVVRTASLDEAGLLLLENDEWAGRAWTYQELVNSKKFCFATEGGSVSRDGQQFLSDVMAALDNYKKAHRYDTYMLRILHPRLDNLEDSIADWRMANYLERSAYQVMSSMDRRTVERPDDVFHAMIGAISAEPLSSRYKTTLHLAEYFMQLCEEKGDFSFIYSSALRSNVPGRSWRPLAGPLPAILPWHTFGDGQSGKLEPSCLRLNNMCRMTRGTLSSEADEKINIRLPRHPDDSTSGNGPDRILARLRQIGFTGCGNFLELNDGYFFPQSSNAITEDVIVIVAAGVEWTHGGPGLITTQDAAGVNHFRDVGVFVGPVPAYRDSIDLA